MASQLLQPFTSQEVFAAAKSLSKVLCLGKDGIEIGFYLHYWDFLGQTLLTRVVNLIFSMGNMLAEWTDGIIYMTPKSDAQCDEVSKLRPITFLNVV